MLESIVVLVALIGTASAQQSPPRPCTAGLVRDHGVCVQLTPKHIDIEHPLELGGRVRALTLLQFIERAHEELERATLEKQSFLPRLVQTVDDAL